MELIWIFIMIGTVNGQPGLYTKAVDSQKTCKIILDVFKAHPDVQPPFHFIDGSCVKLKAKT